MNNDLARKIEALLFALGKPLSRGELSKMLSVSEQEVAEGIAALALRSSKGGIVLVDDGTVLELRVAGEAAALVEEARKSEYSRDIGRAGLEALAIVLYRGPSTRAQIDFIRGVNSSQTLRTLTMRGLVRRVPNPRDERSFRYEPTTDLLADLGVAEVSALPDYDAMRTKLEELRARYQEDAAATSDPARNEAEQGS